MVLHRERQRAPIAKEQQAPISACCPQSSLAACHSLLQLVVRRLQDSERSLPSSILADQVPAIPAVLHVGQNPARGAEVGEDPRRHASQTVGPGGGPSLARRQVRPTPMRAHKAA